MTTPSDELLHACLNTLEDRGWQAFSLEHVAQCCGVPLVELTRYVPDKKAVLDRFFDRLNTSVFEMVDEEADSCPRDVFFEHIMCRLEALTPYRSLIQKLNTEALKDPCLAVLLASHGTSFFQTLITRSFPHLSPVLQVMSGLVLLSIYGKVSWAWVYEDASNDELLAQLDRMLDTVAPFLTTLAS